MNKNQLLLYPANILILVVLMLFGPASSVFALGSRCYVDVYEYAEYIGAHTRIEGPTKLRNLRTMNGENWDSRIDSLVMGPNAKLHVYENPNYKLTLSEISKHPELMRSLGISAKDVAEESELMFGPNERVHHLGEYNFHKKARSLKIDCVK